MSACSSGCKEPASTMSRITHRFATVKMAAKAKRKLSAGENLKGLSGSYLLQDGIGTIQKSNLRIGALPTELATVVCAPFGDDAEDTPARRASPCVAAPLVSVSDVDPDVRGCSVESFRSCLSVCATSIAAWTAIPSGAAGASCASASALLSVIVAEESKVVLPAS